MMLAKKDGDSQTLHTFKGDAKHTATALVTNLLINRGNQHPYPSFDVHPFLLCI